MAIAEIQNDSYFHTFCGFLSRHKESVKRVANVACATLGAVAVGADMFGFRGAVACGAGALVIQSAGPTAATFLRYFAAGGSIMTAAAVAVPEKSMSHSLVKTTLGLSCTVMTHVTALTTISALTLDLKLK